MPTGQRLKTLRRRANLSQEELSGLTGIPQKTISNYENDTEMTANNAVRLAHVFQVSTDYLLGLDDNLNLTDDKITPRERIALNAWRQGDRITAIKVIVEDE